MQQVKVRMLPMAGRKEGAPVFEPASIPCGSITEVVIMEKETHGNKTGVAMLIEMPDGTKVMVKTTAIIMDGVLSATRHGCVLWGDTENWKQWMEDLQAEAVQFAGAYCGADTKSLEAAYKKWKKKQGIDFDSVKMPGI